MLWEKPIELFQFFTSIIVAQLLKCVHILECFKNSPKVNERITNTLNTTLEMCWTSVTISAVLKWPGILLRVYYYHLMPSVPWIGLGLRKAPRIKQLVKVSEWVNLIILLFFGEPRRDILPFGLRGAAAQHMKAYFLCLNRNMVAQ